MRIASIVTAAFTAPPTPKVIYAPIGVAMEINAGLAKRGHEVTFFAPEGSDLEGVRIVTGGIKPFHEYFPALPLIYQAPDVRSSEREKIINLWEQRLFAELYRMERQGAFDLIHSHAPDRGLPFSFLSRTPTVYTLHTPLYSWHEKVFSLFEAPHQYFISISDAQRKPAPDLNWLRTIYNGIDPAQFPFSPDPGDFFLFLGRINPDKGAGEAVDAARRAGSELRIVGDQGPSSEGTYWKERIAPHLDGRHIRYEGLVPRQETFRFYQRAKATLIPIQWEEPFGLTMIESMACGTPVIAFRRGSVPEIVRDGVTGFIVDTVEEMADAMQKVNRLDRSACRKYVEDRFTLERMVGDYERAFQDVYGRRKA